jgi:hypothetical protein
VLAGGSGSKLAISRSRNFTCSVNLTTLKTPCYMRLTEALLAIRSLILSVRKLFTSVPLSFVKYLKKSPGNQLSFELFGDLHDHPHIRELSFSTRINYIHWIDAFKILLNGDYEFSSEMNGLAQQLTNARMSVESLKLEEVDFPMSKPTIPAPPSTFEYWYQLDCRQSVLRYSSHVVPCKSSDTLC